jgi:hypothetical protein
MFAALFVDGEPAELVEDTPDTVSLEFSADHGCSYRCRACGEELAETLDGYQTDAGEYTCADFEPADDGDPDYEDGPHDPERVPLAWCNSAALHSDESDDSVTVSISVGDPRGAFTFTIRRIPDDVEGDLAGQLIMHVPYAGESTPHMPLSPLRDGAYLVGAPYQVRPDVAVSLAG